MMANRSRPARHRSLLSSLPCPGALPLPVIPRRSSGTRRQRACRQRSRFFCSGGTGAGRAQRARIRPSPRARRRSCGVSCHPPRELPDARLHGRGVRPSRGRGDEPPLRAGKPACLFRAEPAALGRFIFTNFVVKDTLYYFVLWVLPLTLGFTIASPLLGIPITLPLLLTLTLTLSFLSGLCTVFFLSSVYSRQSRRSRRSLLSLPVSRGDMPASRGSIPPGSFPP